MSEMWQDIAVWTMVGLAGLWALWTGIGMVRALRRGECGKCRGCSDAPPPRPPVNRVAFLPADQLRNSRRDANANSRE